MENLFTANFGKFDPLNSTYMHEIFLKNGKILKGYSKGRNVPELADKDTLIQKVSTRLVHNGYGHPKSAGTAKDTACIAFYLNDPVDPELIFVLYQNGNYELAPSQLNNKVLQNFLERLKESIQSGKERRNLIKNPRKKDFTSLDLKFPSYDEAFKHAQNLINKYGYSPGEANKWLADWIKKNGGNLKK